MTHGFRLETRVQMFMWLPLNSLAYVVLEGTYRWLRSGFIFVFDLGIPTAESLLSSLAFRVFQPTPFHNRRICF